MALDLALKAKGETSPNPLVGAVVVKNERIIAKGFHSKAGMPHAELLVLKNAGKKAIGGRLYVTLEPCSHYGRTAPCVNEIIKSKIKDVIIGMRDPNPVNNGRGIQMLRKHGIKVKVGVLEKELKKINEPFIKYITKALPFITVKLAQSLDGKIATRTGDSKWITSKASREYSRMKRRFHDGIMVGVNTLMKDDPFLNSKPKSNKFPIKIIVDSKLKTPLNARILSKRSPAPVIIAVSSRLKNENKIKKFKSRGIKIIFAKERKQKLDLRDLLKKLAKIEITNILVEGGGKLIGSFFDAGLVDKALFFIAPKIIGGEDAISSVEGCGVKKISKTPKLRNINFRHFKQDILIEGYIY